MPLNHMADPETIRKTRQSAWIVRAGRGNQNLAAEFERANVVLLNYSPAGDLTGKSRQEIRATVEEAFPSRVEAHSSFEYVLNSFVNEMRLGDIVITPTKPSEGEALLGVISGPYEYRTNAPVADWHHVRRVDWKRRLLRTELPVPARTALGAPRAITQIREADELLDLVGAAQEVGDPLHLLLKWRPEEEPRTIALHQEIEQTHGSVWWGKIGDPEGRAAMSDSSIERFRKQLEDGVQTHAYLYRSGEIWRTDLLSITRDEAEVDSALVPAYYGSSPHNLWVQIQNFTALEPDWALHNLRPAGPRAEDSSMRTFLGSRGSVLYVQERGAQTKRNSWWVNQGQSYRQGLEGRFLWSPQVARDGRQRPYYSSMLQVAEGDAILHYSVSAIRAVGRALGAGVEATRPPGIPDAWNEDGYRVEAEYLELERPIQLSEIPMRMRVPANGPFATGGSVQQGYLYRADPAFVRELVRLFKDRWPPGSPFDDWIGEGSERDVDLEVIAAKIRGEGMRISDKVLRRFHLSLLSRGFVILSGVSGTGKTWLTEAYAKAVGALHKVVPVAPNWTSNEDLLGYLNPIDNTYHDTPFTDFIRQAAAAWARDGESAPRHFLVLDEMNLARVEYYFAKFLSGMEVRFREGVSTLELAPGHDVQLTPNLLFVGTVNVDETTHGFADKVYDRAQLIELEVTEADLREYLGDAPWAETLLSVWRALKGVAPFAYRVADEIKRYVNDASEVEVPWEEALDEQLIQKVLPKIKGQDIRVGEALDSLVGLGAENFPLTTAKSSLMREQLNAYGFTSFF